MRQRLRVEPGQRRVERVLHHPGVAPGRAGGDRLALVEPHARAALGEERGQRAADDPAADHRHVGVTLAPPPAAAGVLTLGHEPRRVAERRQVDRRRAERGQRGPQRRLPASAARSAGSAAARVAAGERLEPPADERRRHRLRPRRERGEQLAGDPRLVAGHRDDRLAGQRLQRRDHAAQRMGRLVGLDDHGHVELRQRRAALGHHDRRQAGGAGRGQRAGDQRRAAERDERLGRAHPAAAPTGEDGDRDGHRAPSMNRSKTPRLQVSPNLPITRDVNPRIRTSVLLPCLLAALCLAVPAQAMASWGSMAPLTALPCDSTPGTSPGAVDTTAAPPTGWQGAPVNVTLNATGAAHMEYMIDCGNPQTAPMGTTVPMGQEGTHTLSHRAVDGGGLTTNWVDETVQVDTTTPTNTTPTPAAGTTPRST